MNTEVKYWLMGFVWGVAFTTSLLALLVFVGTHF